MEEEKYVLGCKNFTGGEIKHHPSCPFYPESLSRVYYEMEVENKRLENEIRRYERKGKYCKCEFVMIRRDQETQKAYCFSCGKEIDES